MGGERFCALQTEEESGEFGCELLGINGPCPYNEGSEVKCVRYEPAIEKDLGLSESLADKMGIGLVAHAQGAKLVSTSVPQAQLYAMFYDEETKILHEATIISILAWSSIDEDGDKVVTPCAMALFDGQVYEIMLDFDPDHTFIGVTHDYGAAKATWQDKIDAWTVWRDQQFESIA